jgi:hypothetical protein
METCHIVDLAPTILYQLGYPIPENMDGQVIRQAFSPDFLAGHPVQIGPAVSWSSNPKDGGDDYSQVYEDSVMRRLKDLGYL